MGMSGGGELDYARFNNYIASRQSTHVIADLYDGSDFTFVTDVKNIPDNVTDVTFDAEKTGFFWIFVLAVLFTGGALLIQVYDYVYHFGKDTMREQNNQAGGGNVELQA